jgi:CelD/BcsL family acetyltransferase involved in cellulose biosynthesis
MSNAQVAHVARTLEEVEALRPLWQRLEPANPEADIDFFAAVVASSPEVLRPHVVALERPDRPPALAVARLEERALEAKLGYRVVARPSVRVLAVVYTGVVGAHTRHDLQALLDELCRALRRGEADVLSFAKVGTESPLFELATRAAPWFCREHLRGTVPRTDVEVPEDLTTFLKARSRNTRDNVKRYGRRLEKAHGDVIAVRAYREPDELERAMAAMEEVAAKTYQRALDVGFRDESRERALLELAARKGFLRAWVLSIDEQPVAFWYGLAYGGTFYIGSPGYDPAFGDLRVGQYLQIRMMEDLCADPGVKRLDYGFGDAQYKRSFGDRTWTEADLLIFRPSFRALRANAVRTGVAGASRAANRALGGDRVAALRRRARRSRVVPA